MFERMAVLLFALGAVILAIGALQARQYGNERLLIAVIGTAALGFSAFVTAVPWRVRCWLLAGGLALGGASLLYLGGFQGPNVMVFTAVGTVLITSCLGVWPALLTLGVFTACFAWVAYAFVELGHNVELAHFDLTSANNWLRVGVTFVLLSVAGITFVGAMLGRLSTALQRGEVLLAESRLQAQERIEAAEKRARLEADLQQAQKFEALGRMAGGVAHDLNNLLVVILNNANWIASIGSDEAKEAAVEIEQAGERASKLARNLLVFGSQQASTLEPIDLDAAITASLRLLRKMLPPDIELLFEPGGVGTVRSCASELDQVLMNLCLNARDAMPAGGKISLSTRHSARASDTDSFVVLQVHDQGHGIPDAVRPHVFEPFFTTKDRSKGTGLGLAVVHGIVKQHGGRIELQSTIGKGTTFEVWLPLAGATQNAAAAPRTTPQGGACKPTATNVSNSKSNRPKTVLVLEDDDKVRKIVTNVLRSAGHDVHSFALGRDLLAWCRGANAKADLLVTDVNLSEHNGIEIYRHARLLLPDLSCLVCSGSYANPVDTAFFTEPRHGRLDKPFRSADLIESVERLLAGKGESRAP